MAAQVTVGDPRGVATNIDLVMEDANDEIILVEVKAGYNQTFKGQTLLSLSFFVSLSLSLSLSVCVCMC